MYIVFHSFTDVIIVEEGLQILRPYSALISIEQGGIIILSYLLRHGTSAGHTVSFEEPPLTKRQGTEDIF